MKFSERVKTALPEAQRILSLCDPSVIEVYRGEYPHGVLIETIPAECRRGFLNFVPYPLPPNACRTHSEAETFDVETCGKVEKA